MAIFFIQKKTGLYEVFKQVSIHGTQYDEIIAMCSSFKGALTCVGNRDEAKFLIAAEGKVFFESTSPKFAQI